MIDVNPFCPLPYYAPSASLPSISMRPSLSHTFPRFLHRLLPPLVAPYLPLSSHFLPSLLAVLLSLSPNIRRFFFPSSTSSSSSPYLLYPSFSGFLSSGSTLSFAPSIASSFDSFYRPFHSSPFLSPFLLSTFKPSIFPCLLRSFHHFLHRCLSHSTFPFSLPSIPFLFPLSFFPYPLLPSLLPRSLSRSFPLSLFFLSFPSSVAASLAPFPASDDLTWRWGNGRWGGVSGTVVARDSTDDDDDNNNDDNKFRLSCVGRRIQKRNRDRR